MYSFIQIELFTYMLLMEASFSHPLLLKEIEVGPA